MAGPSALLKSNVPVSNQVTGTARDQGCSGSTGVHDDGNTAGDRLDGDRHRQLSPGWAGTQHAHRGRENGYDCRHAEQKSWAIVRIVIGYHRYDTEAELLELNWYGRCGRFWRTTFTHRRG
ncbi:hypothetical protein [Rhodococcus sp. WAY2]|uniref:hypothetical protein n=1 Tax=Rhodococcus sp. WAY2 TaxID=2663121 RepID=UPI00135B24E5|nr:hypothetical protein [Rhodococcus sp. WAY2]